MKTFTIYGASDDLIETSGIDGCDEFYSDSTDDSRIVKHLQIQSSFGNISIYCIYAGSWCFALGAEDGDDFDEFPDWKIYRTWGKYSAYSETVEIDLPDDAILVSDSERFV